MKVLSFDIGGTNTRVAKINENYEIEQVEIAPTPFGDKELFLTNIDHILEKFDLSDVQAIGCGLPGVVDKEKGIAKSLVNVGIRDVEFSKHFKEKWNLNCFLRNDAEVACLAEAAIGAGKDFNDVFFITISTGLGGALCVDKQIQDYVTEVGHTNYVYQGQVTEYEPLVSGTGIPKLAKLNGLDVKNAGEFFKLVSSKDEKALEVYHEWLRILSEFIHLMQNSYEPEIICLTGGVMKAKDVFFEDLKKLNPESNLVECKFNQEAGLVGAAIYAFEMLK